MAKKLALLIGNDEYADAQLTELSVPTKDVEALERVLKRTDIGGFDDVQKLLNAPLATVTREIGAFFTHKVRDDLLVLYFSGHGLLDHRGQLYLALKDTQLNQPLGTALQASFIKDAMDTSLSQRQVLILDCCHSGAFAKGAKGVGAPAITEDTFEVQGYDRAVLASSAATQLSWEGNHVGGETDKSLFTHYLVEGLETGKAAPEGGDTITVDDLFFYAQDRVVRLTPKMKPLRSVDGQGRIVIARNPYPVIQPAALPPEWQGLLDSSNYLARETGVQKLAGWLRSETPSQEVAATQALKALARKERDYEVRKAVTHLLETANVEEPQSAAAVTTPQAAPPRVRRGFVPGEAIRDYVLEAKLGAGGFGEVWRARQSSLDRAVAIKIMHSHLTEDQRFQRRFRDEAMALAKFDHPHIVTVFDFFASEGSFFLVMAYVEGQSLADVIDKRGPLTQDEALTIMTDVLDALDFAHQKTVIHRDVKPSNILVQKDGHALLVDFGIALIMGKPRITQQGTHIGTPEYMSPEQITARNLDHRTDEYSAGCVLYEMLTGRPPFGSQDEEVPHYTLMERHLNTPPEPLRNLNPAVDAATEAVVLKAMAKDPHARFGGCGEMAEALRAVGKRRGVVPETAESTPAGKPEIEKPPSPPSPEKPGLRFGVVAVVVAVIGVLIGGVILWIDHRVEKAAEQAQQQAEQVTDGLAEKARALVAKANQALANKDVKEADIYLRLLADFDRDHRDLTRLRAELQKLKDEQNKAREAKRQAELAAQRKAEEAAQRKAAEQERENEIAELLGKAETALSGQRIEVAEDVLRQLETLDRDHSALPGLRAQLRKLKDERNKEQVIASLLEKAERAFGALRLTTPPGDNAFEYYREVLNMDRGHAQAKEGLSRIAERYLGWAERAIDQNKPEKAEEHLNKASTVDSDYPRIREVRLAVEQARAEHRRAEEEALRKAQEAARRKAEQQQRKKKIAEFLDNAEKALSRYRLVEAADYVEKASSVDPDHPAVRKLRTALEKASAPGRAFRDVLKNGGHGPEMVVIPAGQFRMGDIQGGGGSDEKPVHDVRIGRAFAMGKHEVTFEEYDRFVESTGHRKPSDSGWGRGKRPVINVSWDDAKAYVQWLSRETGEEYRLPSEAEWEYAARAKTDSARYWGEDADRACDYANVHDLTSQKINGFSGTHHACDDGYAKTAPVGRFKANGFVLKDMLGNVWEWVEDCYHDSYNGAPKDGLARTVGNCGRRVLRGGSWGNVPRSVRSAYRYRDRRRHPAHQHRFSPRQEFIALFSLFFYPFFGGTGGSAPWKFFFSGYAGFNPRYTCRTTLMT